MLFERELYLCLSLFACLVHCLDFSETPEYILPCNRSDPHIDKCIANTFNHLRSYLVNGIEELNVPSIEPLVIHKLQVDNGHGAIRVKAAFQNITVHGGSNYTINNVKANVPALRIDLAVSVPRIEITGKYEITGNVLLLPVRSKGEFWCAFDDVSGVGKLQGKEITKDGETFMKIEKLYIDFKLKKSKFKVKSRLGGGNVLEEAINNFLNTNAEAIIDEMKQPATNAISKYFKGLLNTAFLQLPLRVWLKD